MDVNDADFVLFGTELSMPDSMMRKAKMYIMRSGRAPVEFMDQIARMKEERNEVLMSMDRGRIVDYAIRWGVNMAHLPIGEDEFRWAVHIAISSITNMPMEFRVASKRYLVERGLPVFDDGAVQV